MDQNPQVFPIHTELSANLFLISLFEQNTPEKLQIARGQFLQNLANDTLGVFGKKQAEGIRTGRGIGRLRLFIHRVILAAGAIMLHQDVIAHRIYKSPKTLRLPDATLTPQSGEYADESLLADIFDRFTGL